MLIAEFCSTISADIEQGIAVNILLKYFLYVVMISIIILAQAMSIAAAS